jgi:hypothetical protein
MSSTLKIASIKKITAEEEKEAYTDLARANFEAVYLNLKAQGQASPIAAQANDLLLRELLIFAADTAADEGSTEDQFLDTLTEAFEIANQDDDETDDGEVTDPVANITNLSAVKSPRVPGGLPTGEVATADNDETD